MVRRSWLALSALVPLTLFWNASPPVHAQTGATPAGEVVLYDEMLNHVSTKAQVIWDVTSAALDDDGNLSAEKMKPDDWAQLQLGVQGLQESLNRLASARKVTVALQGQKIQDEDSPEGTKAADIQKYIDANPDGFRQYAAALSEFVGEIGKAAARKDAAAVNDTSGDLDEKCEGCHKTFWFPNAKK